MSFLIQQTLIYAVPLMIVALAGVFAERSGIINLALEGIMIFGAFIGVLFVRQMQGVDTFIAAKAAGDWGTLQGLVLLAMLVSAAMGALFSLLLSFASINLRADQTIGGTALNLLAPALVLFFIHIIANQNTLNMASGDSASWFMIKKSTLGIDKSVDLGFFGETFVNKVYLATYVCILLFIILSILLYKTRFGLRLRACGENPQAADSLGINVYKMRYAGTTISGALAGMGGFVYALTTANCSSNGDVAGFGFLALAVMIFGNWKPLNIAGASLLFGLFKCIAAAYTSLDINGDGVTEVPRTVTLQGEDADHAVSQRVDWISYDASGTASRVLSTYHDVADGWYLQLPEGWPERVWVGRSTSPDEIGITFYTDSSREESYVPVLRITALSGSERERLAVRTGRFILGRNDGVIYVGELLKGNQDWKYSVTEDEVRASFSLIGTEWSAGDN